MNVLEKVHKIRELQEEISEFFCGDSRTLAEYEIFDYTDEFWWAEDFSSQITWGGEPPIEYDDYVEGVYEEQAEFIAEKGGFHVFKIHSCMAGYGPAFHIFDSSKKCTQPYEG